MNPPMDCPRCGQPAVADPICPRCGVIVAKARSGRPASPRPPVTAADEDPQRAGMLVPTLTVAALLVAGVVCLRLWQRIHPSPRGSTAAPTGTGPAGPGRAGATQGQEIGRAHA